MKFELVAPRIAFGTALLGVTALLTARRMPEGSFGLVLASGLAGMCLSDFISGFVHWAADSYGSNTEIVRGSGSTQTHTIG